VLIRYGIPEVASKAMDGKLARLIGVTASELLRDGESEVEEDGSGYNGRVGARPLGEEKIGVWGEMRIP